MAEAQCYIVMGPIGTFDISVMQFMGPVPSNDVNAIEGLMKRLSLKALDDISESEAQELHSDKNPWLRALGEIRLDPGKWPDEIYRRWLSRKNKPTEKSNESNGSKPDN